MIAVIPLALCGLVVHAPWVLGCCRAIVEPGAVRATRAPYSPEVNASSSTAASSPRTLDLRPTSQAFSVAAAFAAPTIKPRSSSVLLRNHGGYASGKATDSLLLLHTQLSPAYSLLSKKPAVVAVCCY